VSPAVDTPVVLLRALAETGWRVPDAAYIAVTATPPREVQVTFEDSDAEVLIRPSSTGAVIMFLMHPLDPALPDGVDGMAGELAATHKAICAAALTGMEANTEIIADGRVLLRLRISQDVFSSDIEQYVAALSEIATRTSSLHQQLRGTVRTWHDRYSDQR
jgi:hypothetical protein